MEEAYIELSPKEVKNTSIVFLFLSVIALSWAMLQTLAPIEDDMGGGLFIVSMIATIMFVIALMLHMPLLRGI